MNKTQLHITNGGVLTNYLEELQYKGTFLTWYEMLCEGSTAVNINSNEFLEKRAHFLNEFYDIEIDKQAFNQEISKLDTPQNYSEIILWFEYDLFCHINLIAVINLIKQKNITLPLYLVCSGRVKNSKTLKALGELTPNQLENHYQNRILLKNSDIELAITLWDIYNSDNHNLFKPYIIKPSSFTYLSNCLKAHLKRFPDSKNGLNTLEANILEIINKNDIKSKHHLLGYTLNYQGFYGFGDIQLERIINHLSLFFDETETKLILNKKGHKALLKEHNFSKEINDTISFGAAKKSDFHFNIQENKLVKIPVNDN